MSDFLDTIKQRVAESNKRMSEVAQRFQSVQQEFNAAQQEHASWMKIVEVETKREQSAAPLLFTANANNNTPSEQEVISSAAPMLPARDGNKTDMVRDLLKSRQPNGMQPSEIWEQLQNEIPRPYLYSVLKRLKDRDEVLIRRGKYFFRLQHQDGGIIQ